MRACLRATALPEPPPLDEHASLAAWNTLIFMARRRIVGTKKRSNQSLAYKFSYMVEHPLVDRLLTQE
jgi:hypothetical protein